MNWNPFGRRAKKADAQAQAQVLDETSPLFSIFANLYATHAGVSVTSDSAVASVAVLACIIVRCESLMLCPCNVIRRQGADRILDDEHPAARLLNDEWNPFLGAEEGWRWKQITEDLRGNAYARVEWRNGKPVNLWPLLGQSPELRQSGGKFFYRYQGDGVGNAGLIDAVEFTRAGDFPLHDILHFKGPLLQNPYLGRSLVAVTSENIGISIATEEFFARFLGNGTHFPQYLQTDEKLEPKDIDALREQLEGTSGIFSAGELRIFDKGLKVMQNSMSLRDAQLTEHQRWILEQVCRTWRVPLPLVQDLSNGTYSNSEQSDLWLAKYTVTPICRNTEGVVRRGLFLPSERRVYTPKFSVDGLMRGDFKTRAACYSILIGCGVLNPNESRAFEDWNAYEGGEEYSRIAYRETSAMPDDGTDSASKPGGDNGPAASRTPLFIDAMSRIRTRAEQDRSRGREPAATLEFAERVLEPVAQAYHELGVELDTSQAIDVGLKELL